MTDAPFLDRDEMLALAEYVTRSLRAHQTRSHILSEGFVSVEVTDEPGAEASTAAQPPK